jgi:hypothetical protein
VRLGFNPHGVISFQLAPPTAKYSLDGKAPQLYRTVLDSLQSIPGVAERLSPAAFPLAPAITPHTP